MSNLEILEEDYREYYDTWNLIQYMDMPMKERHELHRIVKEEWDPNYPLTPWCGPCIVDMLKYAFNQLDKK
jgi:hypothetical protein